jgi:hypothetical protein
MRSMSFSHYNGPHELRYLDLTMPFALVLAQWHDQIQPGDMVINELRT